MAAELILRVKVDRSDLIAFQGEIAAGKTLTVKATSQGVDQTKDSVNKLGQSAKTATSQAQSLGDMLAKKIAWYAISQSIMKVVVAFKDALNTMKEVDKELAVIQKVTGFSDVQIDQIKSGAYEVASAYGVAAQAYLESVSEFARAGYKEAAEGLGELATKTQLAGDVSSEVANQFLLSVDAAWKYNGSVEALSKVLDEANEVGNNYATSIEKIAKGLPNVASVASMVGMSTEETIAALGTITAVTQQSAAKASTALRALILNITGNINGMFEDEAGQMVSWTDEELSVMQKFLHKYAQDVLDAAQSAGELVNPIDAIRALGKALENGQVSARDMYTELSSLGGKLRTNQLVALVENYRMVDEMLGKMENSAGSASREIDILLGTWESKSNILKNTFAEFVEKNIGTQFFKDMLDWATGFVQTLTAMEHPLAVFAAGLAALLAPTIVKTIRNTAAAFVDLGRSISGVNNVKNLASSVGTAVQTIATVAIIAGLAIFNKYQEYLRKTRESAQEATNEAKENADKAIADAENIQDLYDAFVSARRAMDGTEESKQAYIASAEALKTALGEEAKAIDVTKMSLTELDNAFKSATASKLENAIKEAEDYASKAQINTVTLADTNRKSKNPILQAGRKSEQFYNPNSVDAMDQFFVVEYSDQERYRRMIEEYAVQKHALKEAQKKYSEDDSEENREEILRIQGYIDEVKDVMDQAYDARMALAIAEANLTAFENGKTRTNADATNEFASAEEAAAAAAEEAVAKLQRFSVAFDEITNSAQKATAAIEAYNEATSTEVTDDAQAMVDAYQALFEEVEKGNYGSVFVTEGIDLLLSDQIINKYKGNTKKLADLLTKDFYKQIFVKGKDEKSGEWIFADGEEVAQRFANVFKDQVANGVDEAGNAVLRFKDETYATLIKTKQGWELNIEDINELSKAMGGIDPDVLISFVESLGIKTGNHIKMTVDEIYELADAASAVHETAKGIKEIDLARIVETAFAQGKQVGDVWKLVNALKEADKAGDIDLVIDWAEVDMADQQTRDLINSLDKAGIPITTYVDYTQITDAQAAADKLSNTLQKPMEGEVNILTNVDSVLYKMQQLRAEAEAKIDNPFNIKTGFASGTDSAKGGVALVNEEGAEIIQEGDKARIAAGGLPTLTYIKSGAKVWTAKETEAILANSGISSFLTEFDAFASGKGVPKSISDITHNASKSVKIGSTESDKTLEWHQNYVELRKAEYDLAEAREVGTNALIKKENQIKEAIKGQIEYLKKIKGSQTDIDKLATEYYQIDEKIAELRKKEKEEKEKEKQEEYEEGLKKLKDVVELRESELRLIEAKGWSIKAQIKKERQIYDAVGDQIKYLKKNKASQKEINDLLEKQYDIQDKIKKLNKQLYENLEKSINNEIEKLNNKRDKELEKLDKKIEKLRTANEEEDKAAELQEHQLKVEEAREKLANARAERTIRYYNSKTKQWEWKADAEQVKSAKDELAEAKKSLQDYKDEQKLNSRIEALEKKKDEVTQKYLDKTDKWQKVLDSMAEPVDSISKSLRKIEENATKDQKSTLDVLNKLLKPLGYKINTSKLYDSGGILSGTGGIKGTSKDEVILPPDIASKMLKPISTATLNSRLNELRYLYGATGVNAAGITSNSSIGSQYNGNLYTFGNITLTEGQARSTTIYDLVQRSRGLRAYSGGM